MRRTEIRGTCPVCYRAMTAATDPFSDQVPSHGDLALCGGCGAFNIFDFSKRKNTLRRPTPEESLGIGRNPGAQRLLGQRQRAN